MVWVLYECLPLIVLLEDCNLFDIAVPFENLMDVIDGQLVHELVHLQGGNGFTPSGYGIDAKSQCMARCAPIA